MNDRFYLTTAIFYTDICGGHPAVIVAMLVRSRTDSVDLLPALPAAWPAGAIRGVRLRGGLRLERLAWSAGTVEVDVVHRGGRPPRVTAPPGWPVVANVTRDAR